MVNYSKLATTAQRLIESNGKVVTLVQINTTPADVAKPWRGSADPRSIPTALLEVNAVLVSPSGNGLGLNIEISDFLKRCKKVAIVSSTADLSIYNELVEADNTQWKIEGIEVLKPANTILLYYLGLSR